MNDEKEIPFGAFDSELMQQEINIPEGFEANIKGDKIILKKIESDDERIRGYLIKWIQDNYYHGTTEIPTKTLIAWLEKQGEQSSLNINRECLKGIKRVQEYQDLSDWEKEFDKIASMYAHNKNQEGYNDSWYVKERAAEMLYYAKKELEKQGGQKPDWSKEDEEQVSIITNIVKAHCGKLIDCSSNLSWLQSLKQRKGG